jgi:hypothetical protein
MFAIEANLVSLARIGERPLMLPGPTAEEIQGPPSVMLLDHLASLPRFGQQDEARSRCAFNHPVSDAEEAIFH